MAMERYFIQEGVIRSEIESFLKHELNRAGYSGINIQKTPLTTRVILYVEKPPLVIGKKGKRINRLTKLLIEKFGVEKPTIDVQKIDKPTLDANIVARRIAVALERGMNRRRVVYKALRAVMSSGARGIEIVLSGKIVGKGGRSRTEKYAQGYMKKAGDSTKLVKVGRTQAYLKAGVIGVTVKIVPPDAVFPDQISVKGEEPEDEVVETVEEIKEPSAEEKPEETKEIKAKKAEKKEDAAAVEKKPKDEEKKKKQEKPKAAKKTKESAEDTAEKEEPKEAKKPKEEKAEKPKKIKKPAADAAPAEEKPEKEKKAKEKKAKTKPTKKTREPKDKPESKKPEKKEKTEKTGEDKEEST